MSVYHECEICNQSFDPRLIPESKTNPLNKIIKTIKEIRELRQADKIHESVQKFEAVCTSIIEFTRIEKFEA